MKLIFDVKSVILLLLLLSLGGYFLLGSSWQQQGQEESGLNQQQAAQPLPDFDRRKAVQAAKPKPEQAPVDADFNADEVLAQSQQQLDVIIEEYNQVLGDPEARKVLEQRMQETAQQYKKAILAKVRKGEI